MILKPYIGSVNSLPSESGNSHKKAHYSSHEENEAIEFLKSEGRLMMLTTLYHERNLKKNKLIHDIWKVFNCEYPWPLCICNFAKTIRGYDMSLSIERIDYLREIL